jgi:hypothetical protein
VAVKYQTIAVKARPDFRTGEAISSAAIKPGMVVEPVAAGTVRPNQVVTAGLTSRTIALEDLYTGGTVTTEYASGARVRWGIFLPGDEVQLLLKASEVAVVQGVLRLDNAGRAVVAGSDAPFARALEAKTPSADELIWARLL